MNSIELFTPPFSAYAWEDLRGRIRRTRWPDEIQDSSWGNGFDLDFLKDLCRYWSEDFDWQAQIGQLSQFPHYRFEADKGKIHFLHVKGKGPAAIPLVMTHGWPGSFLEMLEIIPLLTNPAEHGFAAEVSFDVVVPSLPGFGFSDRPQIAGVGAFHVAEIWVELMQALGYDRFAAQGGDIGAGVSTALGLCHSEHLIGVHLNYIPGSYKPYLAPGTEITADERQFLADAAHWYGENGAYAHLQSTRPQTPAYALNDSPAGLAAWILEKVYAWSDDWTVFNRDDLLTTATIYWVTQTINSSTRFYYQAGRDLSRTSAGQRVDVPTGVATFPVGAEPNMPRSLAERVYRIERWTDLPHGGHFPAFETPDTLVEELRSFFRPLRFE